MSLYDLKTFNSNLPYKPYCTDFLQLGLKIRALEKALKHKYIQVNDNYIKFLVIDCDHTNANIYIDANIAPPNIIIRNPLNGHFHYVYALAYPIYKDYQNKAKNLAYFAKIQQAYTNLCKGDTNYINLIAKNPNHNHWQTTHINHFYPYSLDELADYVTLPQRLTKKQAMGEGRNCFLFDSIRVWAYKQVLFYKNNQATYTDFYNLLLDRLQKLNTFQNAPSLAFTELKAISKSVAKFCWSNFSNEKFSQIQTVRSHTREKVKKLKSALSEVRNEFY